MHGDAGINQKIFQLNGLNQVRVPENIETENLLKWKNRFDSLK